MSGVATSADLYERASIIPGRSMTRSKKVFKRSTMAGQGATIIDTDGKDYIDTTCAFGAVSLGYRAVDWHAAGVYSFPHQLEVYAAEAVLREVAPWATHVKFQKTGTEATSAALLVARAATGRHKFAMGDWAYHGWAEQFTDKSTSRVLYPAGGDPWWSGESLAAVFVEPHRFDQVDVPWLRRLAARCAQTGTLLIFDEMVQGGRLALGGGTEYFNIAADLCCYGKAFGNSQAVAFVVGRDVLAQSGDAVSGTFSGCATGLCAVLNTIRTYREEPVLETLWSHARRLHHGFSHAVPATFAVLTGPAPLMGIRFVNPEHKQPFAEGMWARGVAWYPDWVMTSFSHTDAQIQQVIDTAGEVCRTLAAS